MGQPGVLMLLSLIKTIKDYLDIILRNLNVELF